MPCQSAKQFIQNGGAIRSIISISRDNFEAARIRLDIGEDLRHSYQFHEIFLLVSDKQQSISATNIGLLEYTLNTPRTAFRCDSPAYAEYLLTSFENVSSEAVPAEERIQGLLKHG